MSDLRDWLENAEIKYRKIFGATALPAGLTNGDIQVFAYHNRHTPASMPVICIGSNYSQGDSKTQTGSAANLDGCLRHYFHMRDVFEQQPQWKRDWVQHGWSSARFPILPARDDIFFIMTNLCPWITKDKSWLDLASEDSEKLLLSSQLLHQFLHVEELIACLLQQGREYAIVGHGINPNILKPLRDFLDGRDRWVVYANLAYKQSPSRWDDDEKRFVF